MIRLIARDAVICVLASGLPGRTGQHPEHPERRPIDSAIASHIPRGPAADRGCSTLSLFPRPLR